MAAPAGPSEAGSLSLSKGRDQLPRTTSATRLRPSFDGVTPQAPPSPAVDPAVRISHVTKRYGTGPIVLDDISLDIAPGEFVCLLGASGCGKSTLLNLIAGLERTTAGGIDLSSGSLSPSTKLRNHPSKGGAAVMFQESALMPWLTARQNVELALRLRGVPRAERRTEALRLLGTVNLAEAGDKRPHELSGGMRQRVALARALAQDRDVLLMDEPFAALDALTRRKMQEELLQLWEEVRFTLLFVTHSIEEALVVGHRIAILSPHPGRLRAEVNSHQFGLHSLGGAAFQATAQRVHRLLFDEPQAPGSVAADARQLAQRPAPLPGHLPFRVAV